MRRNKIIWFLLVTIIWWILSPSVWIYSQVPVPDSIVLHSEMCQEKLHLFTDRNMYASGERIFFRIYNLSSPELKEIDWSTILYVELIDALNHSLANGKFKMDEQGSSGYIFVPENITTGNYFLRAYTKWMRNFSPYEYAFTRVKIINPYSPETNDLFPPAGSGDSLFVQYKGKTNVPENHIKCSTGKETYARREKVTVQFTLPDKTYWSEGGYCVSVIVSGSSDSIIYGIDLSNDSEYKYPGRIRFYPETTDISLSGSIVRKNLDTPSSYAVVHLSSPGDSPDYFGYMTGEQGKFNFSLPPWTGSRNFFIGVESKDEYPVEILVDNSLSTEMIHLPSVPFYLSDEEKNIAREIMFNMQVENAFRRTGGTIADTTFSHTSERYFYGEPSLVITTADYVKLPTLEEFFLELIPSVSIIKRKDHSFFVMKGDHPDITFFKPLVLLDFVPVFNIDNLLKVPPEYINRIEVINATYIRGDIYFGGIISIFSHKGDLAGIELPEDSYFFDFKLLEPQDEINFPDYSEISAGKRIPDFRNTLYWNPMIQGNPGETISCDFYTPDNTGKYDVIIRGISGVKSITEGHFSFIVE